MIAIKGFILLSGMAGISQSIFTDGLSLIEGWEPEAGNLDALMLDATYLLIQYLVKVGIERFVRASNTAHQSILNRHISCSPQDRLSYPFHPASLQDISSTAYQTSTPSQNPPSHLTSVPTQKFAASTSHQTANALRHQPPQHNPLPLNLHRRLLPKPLPNLTQTHPPTFRTTERNRFHPAQKTLPADLRLLSA